MATGKEILAALQAGRAVPGTGGNNNGQTIVISGPTTPPKSDCGTSGPTDASVVDQQKIGGQENCEIQFTATNLAGEGAAARVLRIGGGFWWTAAAGGVSKATALGITNNGMEIDANVTTDFGKGAVTFGGSLNAFNDRTQDGVLTTGMCVEVVAGVQPKVTIVRLDLQGDICSKVVQKPICPTCPQDDANDTFCYEFCRILGQYNFIEISLAVASNYVITMNTDAAATANPLVACD